MLAGAGVGGGSLIYANTLYEPPAPFFDDPQWAHITDWRDELAPYYDQAAADARRRRATRTMTPSDEAMRAVADEMGVGDTFHQTPVGVFFGDARDATVPDPYFGGAGPARTGCIECGECMTGCRHGAKNTLLKNYLVPGRAGRRRGPPADHRDRGRAARRRRLATSRPCAPARGAHAGRAHLHRRAGRVRGRHARHPAAAAPDARRAARCRGCPPRLGELTRTNSEALLGPRSAAATATRRPHQRRGDHLVASTRTRDTHIEPVRYGKGSNAMGLLQTLLIDGGGRVPRWLQFARRGRCVTRRRCCGAQSVRRWSERTIIALVMQSLDNSLTAYAQARAVRPAPADHAAGPRRAEPDLDPGRQRRGSRIAEQIDGIAGRHVGRDLQRPADRALPRRLRHRRLDPSTASSTRTTASTATRPCTSSTAPPCRRTSA